MAAETDRVVMQTEIREYPLMRRGKVRDIYDLGDTLLFVATDRISAFDVVMPNGVPGKGRVLTQMSLFWFDFLSDVVESHLVTADVDRYPAALRAYREQLEGRSMIVAKADRVEAECIVRGYISGSMWKELQEARKRGTNAVHGFEFPPALGESEQLPRPIFTPSTKNDDGHDINISYRELVGLVGAETAQRCRDSSLAIYTKAADYARTRGIIIADTKFEFGYKDGRFMLIDEVLSPDSSRFWPVDTYAIGRGQPSFDKQPIRDYLDALDWNKKPPAPRLPEEVVQASAARYREAQRLLTGR
ncbi:MAG TPA: phosphoribosylaminoimidazolesuccinocarboxamide synthase [candidate division Zixibacteria bacterium]|nr:phosphoribosylaminoimidazolesuccinocarboxamide synthase [candidate division Zixibacteria bacterium]